MEEVPESGEPEITVSLERGKSEITSRHSSRAFLDEPVLVGLEDHFTLPSASNLIRFRARKNAARVYEAKSVQMVLEETFDEDTNTRNITVKRLSDETFGVSFLRFMYTIVCCLFAGFMFAFCLQVLLFLVLDLAVESGATQMNPDLHVGAVIGVALAMVVFVHSFAEALVIAGHFIADIWTGHYLARQFLFRQLSSVIIEWIFFSFFLLLPLLVMSAYLLAQSGDWWSNTAIVWFGCIMAFFAIFAFNIVYYEVKAAYDFSRNLGNDESENVLSVIKRCLILRQRHHYSGKYLSVFLARSYVIDSEDTENTERSTIYEETRVVTKSWWARLSTKFPDKMFKKLEQPYRLFTLEDVQDYRPFLTKATWGLEKIFCRPSNSRYIAIVEGPGALSRSQLRSSLICSLIGTALIIVVLVAFLVWFQTPGAFVAFVFIAALLASWSSLINTRNLFKIGQDILDIKLGRIKDTDDNPEDEEKPEANESKEEEAGPEESWQNNPDGNAKFGLPPRNASQHLWEKVGAKPSEAVYLVSEYMRITEATDVFCWLMIPLEILVFYVYPLSTLSKINGSLAVVFFICATVSVIRHYINVACLIEETGNISLVGGRTEKQKWENKSRLNNIVGHVTAAKTRRLWVSILGCCGFGVLAIFLGAVGSSTANTNTKTYTFLPNFYYPPTSDDMRYPTCTLSNMHGGFGENSTLADFAFLSSIAYQVNPQSALNGWFGPAGIEAIDEAEYVKNFRTQADANDVAVFFKLFSFPQQKFAMIVVRGTSNNWDMLADVQLWSAASLMQGLRAALPAGGIWTPIMAQLVNWINKLQSESLDKISFYRLTTEFANYVKNDTSSFSSVQITGHSLGGGLSIITGAQAGIPAVGLSGPNALISGRSFDPPVTKDQLNQYTFNIIPRRDLVPMLDDKADQFQYIRCEADPWDFVGCHFAKRSLCEILYTCGTGNRPAICECYVEFGYPKPLTDGDEDFDTLCGIASQ